MLKRNLLKEVFYLKMNNNIIFKLKICNIKTYKMKFNFVEERLYILPLKIISFKNVAKSFTEIAFNFQFIKVVSFLKIISTQNNLKIVIDEIELEGQKYLYTEYSVFAMNKALHILGKSIILN